MSKLMTRCRRLCWNCAEDAAGGHVANKGTCLTHIGCWSLFLGRLTGSCCSMSPIPLFSKVLVLSPGRRCPERHSIRLVNQITKVP